MKIVILASGSKGNATYIETNEAKILIDAGINYKQVKNRLSLNGITLNKLDAILVTHEHTDHVSNLISIAVKTSSKIYINRSSYDVINSKNSGGLLNKDVFFIEPNNRYVIKDLTIAPIELSHDTTACYGYIMKERETNATYGYVTDTGYIPKKYLSLLSKVNVISIESNHDVDMLKQSGRPYFLIQRILSKKGHLSNEQCCEYIKDFDFDFVKTIILSHISEECNDEKIAFENVVKTFNGCLPCSVIIAKQYEPLPTIEVENA